ncbi:hypothetical protein, partial [Morganella morganii]|uniref:hypothetical protein n=1 Tax=Morganella morganii TaxID=582 RepID=UPI001952AD4B
NGESSIALAMGSVALTYHLSLKQVNRLFDDDMVDFGEAALRLLDLATEDQAGEDGKHHRARVSD